MANICPQTNEDSADQFSDATLAEVAERYRDDQVPTSAERRRYQRHKFRGLVALCPADDQGHPAGWPVPVSARDISLWGIQVASNEPLAVDETVVVTMVDGARTVHMLGAVRHVQPADGIPWRIGIRFRATLSP